MAARNIYYAHNETGDRVKRFTSEVQNEDSEQERRNRIEEGETGCDSLPGNFVNIQPNPTTGRFEINIAKQNEEDESTLSLMKLNGEMILRKKNTLETVEIDITDRETGVYLLRIESNGGSSEKRIIKR